MNNISSDILKAKEKLEKMTYLGWSPEVVYCERYADGVCLFYGQWHKPTASGYTETMPDGPHILGSSHPNIGVMVTMYSKDTLERFLAEKSDNGIPLLETIDLR